MRGGMGLEGLEKIARFVNEGGLFVTIAGNAAIPIDYGLIDFVSIHTYPFLNYQQWDWRQEGVPAGPQRAEA